MKNIKFITACFLLAIGISEMVRWFIITAKDLSSEAMKMHIMPYYQASYKIVYTPF